jgi:Zn-finger nucleic acid-binding protein
MICPVCKTGTIVVEHDRIELDYCTNCGGAWFDSGELELLLAGLGVAGCSSFLRDILDGVDTRSGERVRRCPVCARKMKKSHIGEQPRVLIDACPRADGLWFDGGELGQLLKQLSDKPSAGPECDRKVEVFLRSAFQAGGDKP